MTIQLVIKKHIEESMSSIEKLALLDERLRQQSAATRYCPECDEYRDVSIRMCECGYDNGKAVFESLRSL